MNTTEPSKKLSWLVVLMGANLVVMIALAVVLVVGLLPKVERAVQAVERSEARFQAFADEVQPVMAAGSGKAIEAILNMDTASLSETATVNTQSLIEAAAESAKRYLERDQNENR